MTEPTKSPPAKGINPRAIAETTAMILVAAGVVMLMQPYSLELYGWSFSVTLAGTALFVVGSKFPTGRRKR